MPTSTRTFFVSLLAFTGIFLFVETASAANPKSLGRFRDWEAYTADEKGSKICYALTSPKESKGNYSRRDPVFLMVTRRPADNVFDEVSAIAGYTYQKNSKPTLSIGSNRFIADAVSDVAWPQVKDGQTLLSRMTAGTAIELKGTSSRGTLTKDIFSLRGFTAALNAVANACPKR
jgi:hypothetical protein